MQKSTPNANARAWIAALRSGEYKQTKKALHALTLTGNKISDEGIVVGGFCCLGVACDLAVKAGVIPTPESNGRVDIYGVAGDRSSSRLPLKVRDWLGLCSLPTESFNGAQLKLIEMNDQGGKSFNEIADFLENAPEGIFCKE